MVEVDFDQFDDELNSMRELMDEKEIALSDAELKVPVKSLRLKRAVVVQSGASIQTAIEKMLARKIGCLLIVKDDKLCGIFTERDILMKIAGENIDWGKTKIDEYMSSDAAHLRLNDTILSALKLMNKGGYRHVAIVDERLRPVSVLSVKDIVSYIVEFFPQDVLNLPPHPIRIGTKNREGA